MKWISVKDKYPSIETRIIVALEDDTEWEAYIFKGKPKEVMIILCGDQDCCQNLWYDISEIQKWHLLKDNK